MTDKQNMEYQRIACLISNLNNCMLNIEYILERYAYDSTLNMQRLFSISRIVLTLPQAPFDVDKKGEKYIRLLCCSLVFSRYRFIAPEIKFMVIVEPTHHRRKGRGNKSNLNVLHELRGSKTN